MAIRNFVRFTMRFAMAALACLGLATTSSEAGASPSCQGIFLGSSSQGMAAPSRVPLLSPSPLHQTSGLVASQSSSELSNAEADEGVFPKEYRLNPVDFKKALELPQTQRLARAVREAVATIEEISLRKRELLFFHPIKAEATAGDKPDVGSIEVERTAPATSHRERTFPVEFFNSSLSNYVKDEESIRSRFRSLNERLGGLEVSDEALVVLAVAARRLSPTSYNGKIQAEPSYDQTVNGIKTHLTRLSQSGHLPDIKDFATATDPIFFITAEQNRNNLVGKAPKRSLPQLESLAEYLERLKVALAEARAQAGLLNPSGQTKDMSVEEKLSLAHGLLEPVLKGQDNNLFNVLVKGRQSVRQLDRWAVIGTFIIREILSEAWMALENPKAMDLKTRREAMEQKILKRTLDPESDAHKIVMGGYLEAERFAQAAVDADADRTKQSIVNEMVAIGLTLKQAVRDHDKMVRQEAETLVKAAAAAARGLPTAPVLARKTQTQSVAGTHIPQALRRAMKESDAATVEEPLAPVEPSPQLAPVQQTPLLGLQLSNAEAETDYWFPGFKSAAQNRKPSKKGKDKSADRADSNLPKGMKVRLTKRVIGELKDAPNAREEFAHWVECFLIGPAAKVGMKGLKKLPAIGDNVWEIKTHRESHRIMMVYDKPSRTWLWQALVPHNHVNGSSLPNRGEVD